MCDEPMELEGRYENVQDDNESEEIQRLTPNQWMRNDTNEPIWQLEESSILTGDFIGNDNAGDQHQNRLASASPIPSAIFSESLTDADSLMASFIPDSTVSYSDSHVFDIETPNAVPGPTVTSPNYSVSLRVSPSPNISQNSFLMDSPICDLEDLDMGDRADSELSNHDRSLEDHSATSLRDIDSNGTPIVSYRLCSMAMPAMPAPSAHACQVANRVIKHARDNKTADERSMWCPDCGLFPTLPVTGPCGHTRCSKCIQNLGQCPCGTPPPKDLHVNTLIQDLITKMLPNELSTSSNTKPSQRVVRSEQPFRSVSRLTSVPLPVKRRHVTRRSMRQRHTRVQGPAPQSVALATVAKLPTRTPISPQTRLEYARELLSSGRYQEASPHLARVAASSEPLARYARTLLAQTISVLSQDRDPRRLTRELYRAVRGQAAATWLKPTDLECVLCYHTYTRPVTTPCGHTYCRTCIERSMDYRKACALCLRSLDDFDLATTRETVFVCSALASIDALNPPLPPDPDIIPIFVCTVAYPAIPCPLFIFDPRYWLMIRRVLESGSRRFGMVAYERDRTYSDYGTVLEVCDCVHLEDGRSILSTVGVSRFRVIERDVRDGCDVARIQPLTDITPTEELIIWDLRIMATQISYKALIWLNSMNRTVRSEIEAAFGSLPHFDNRQEDWWETPDGPAWLWWLIAILPLRSEIKILILSTKNLLKRMMAVSRTLEAIDQVAITTSAATECVLQSALTNAEEWLERSA